jgi:Ca2+-binding RTX toxin-like protein
MFNVFEAGEPDPDNTATAIASFASNKIELSTARSASVVDLAQLMDTVAQFAGISAPESTLSAFRNIPIPMLDSTLTISNLGALLPTYQFSTRVLSASNLDGLNFLKVVQDYLDIKDFTLTAKVDPLALSAKLTANLVADKTIFDVAGFQIAFLGGELTTAIDKGNPSITLKPILKLKNYDPFQSGEPDLTLNGTLYFDPDAFVGGLQLSTATGNAWKNPFGIPDSELRNVGFELGGTFETPYVRQVKVLGDLKFGNYDVKAGFIVNKKDDKKNAIALTVNQPLNAIDLFYGPVRSFALNQLADQIPIVQDGLKFLNQIVPLNLVSIDGNHDGIRDPLISFSREATSIVGQKIKAGLSINGELTAWGKTATLIVDCDLSNTLNPTLTGSLTIPKIDWGFVKLSGVNQSDLSLKFDARFAQTSRLNIPVVGVSLPTSLNAYLSGSASLNLFGRNVASADFYLDTNRININRFNLDAGPLRLELNSLNFDFRRFDGSGSGQIKLFDQKIAEGSFSLNNGNFFATGRLGMSILGKDVGVDARISLGEKGNYIQLNASALGYNTTLFNSSLDPFVNQFKSLDDLKNAIINQIPALKTAGAIYNTAKSWLGFDGYLANSTVFFDANLNGILDDNEPFTTTDAGGGFDLPIDLLKFDTNKNQQIDSGEGKYVLMGGTDISTTLPLVTPLSAVITPTSTAITPLTTIIAEVVQQQGIDPKLAQTWVKAALGLNNTVDLTNFDPLQAIANGDAKGAPIFAAMVMVQNTIVQTAKFVNGVSSNLVAELANGAIAAIANQVKDGTPVDFSKAETIQSIIQNTLTKAAESDPSLNLTQLSTVATAAAQVIALGNQMTQELVISGRPSKEISLEITRLQALSLGQVADDLTQLAAGRITPEEFLAQTTRDAILKQAAEVQVNDPTIRPGLEAATKNLRLTGTNRDDVLGGNLGNDVVIGKKGNDRLLGNGGNDRLQGDQGNDSLAGGRGSDRLTGGDGNDILAGGDGNDILLGGAGKDRFAINVAETGKDKITDFSIRDDLLRIDGLSGRFRHGKPISDRQFHLGNKAADRSDRFIYNARNGALFYDADGLGGSRQMQIAQFSKGLALTAHHILVS